MAEKEELVYHGCKFPKSMSDKILEEVSAEGIDKTAVVRRAVKEHFDRKEHPDIMETQLLALLEKRRDLLEKPVREILERIAVRQLSKK